MSKSKSSNTGAIVGICVLLVLLCLLMAGTVFFMLQGGTMDSFLSRFRIEGGEAAAPANAPVQTASAAQSQLPSDSTPAFVPAQETLLAETPRADDSYLDDLLFLGDSRTVGMVEMGLIDESNAMAIIGLSHTQALTEEFYDEDDGCYYTIEEKVTYRRPDKIMVSFGVNGVAFMSEDEFMDDYEELIDLLRESSPNSAIIIQSILPVGSIQEENDPHLTNERINHYNILLYDLAKDKGVYFLDSSGCLMDENGYLSSEYDSGDGLHFNKEADEVLMDYILTHAVTE